MRQGKDTRRRRAPGRLAAAVLVSILAHALVLLLVFLAWPRMRPWPRTEVTEIALAPAPRSVRPPVKAVRRATTPIWPQARPRKAVRSHRRAAAPSPTHSLAQPPKIATRAPPRTTPKSAATPAPESAPRAPGGPPIDLFAPEALAAGTGTKALYDGDPDALTKARVTRRIHRYIADLKARDRVAAGLVDPYFSRLGDRMGKGFKPTWDEFDPAHAKGLGNAVVAWLKDWQSTAERYALTGSPYHKGETFTDRIGPGDLPMAGTIGGNDSRVLMRQLAQIHDYLRDAVHGKAAGLQLLTLVRVTQSDDGRLLDVEIAQPSGADGYDAYVVRSVKKALAHRLPPKRRGTGLGLRKHRIVSLWAFRTRFVVVPPVPGVGCDFGTNLNKLGKCYYPLEKVVWPHLELVAVY